MEPIEKQITSILLNYFSTWCDNYLSDVVRATPRYCQLDLESINSGDTRLYSTVHGYSLPLPDDVFTTEEWDWFKQKFHYTPKFNRAENANYVWDWWKAIRTEHLINNYPAINPYC